MAGDDRVSFDFLEVLGYQAEHERPALYQSWATERERIHLKSRVDQAGLFRPLFRRAQAIADGEREFDAEADAAFVLETIDGYLADGPEKGVGY